LELAFSAGSTSIFSSFAEKASGKVLELMAVVLLQSKIPQEELDKAA